MTIRLYGILTDGLNKPIVNATVSLIARSNTLIVLGSSEAIFRTDSQGAYNITMNPGHYVVIVGPQGKEPYKAGEIVLYADSPDGSLNGYLVNWVEEELTPDVIKQVQQLVASSEEYALQAGRSAAAANADATDARNSKASAAQSASDALVYKNDAKASEDAARQAQAGAAGSANTATQAVITIQGLKADVEQLKGETTALKDAAAASATQASNSATEAGRQASNAADSAQSASTDAGRAEVAAGKAEQVVGGALLKDNNLSDVSDMSSSRVNLKVDRLQQTETETWLYSSDKQSRLVIQNKDSDDKSWGLYDDQNPSGWRPLGVLQGGTGANNITDAKKNLEIASFKSTDEQSLIYSPDISKYAIFIKDNGDWGCLTMSDGERHPLAINAGGTGATTPDGVRHNLGLATNHIPVFLGVHLDSNNGESSGILYLRNKNAEGVQLSYSRIYNEILGGTAYATIQVIREGGDTNYYQFDESGNAINYNTIAIGRGIINSLGTNSLAIGDSGTGFKQGGDGVLQVFCNGTNVASFDHQNLHLNGLLNICPIDNNANGIRVSGSRIGGGNALIGGQVSGGALGEWRDLASGLLVELSGDDAATSIFKAVRLGYDWVAGLDAIRFMDGNCEAHLHVRGANYLFNSIGIATCSQWLSTSDIRLKTNLKEIKSAREKVKSIKGYTYFKRNNLDEDEYSIYSEQAGVIAQDVQTVLPEAVHKISDSEYLGVSYGGVTALLVNAFNEMSDQVDKQQEEIETLKSEIADLKAAVVSLLNKPTTLES